MERSGKQEREWKKNGEKKRTLSFQMNEHEDGVFVTSWVDS